MAKASKRMRAAYELIEKEKLYSISEAVEVLSKVPPAKFDETVELAVRLGVDPRKADENVRGAVSLPHGTGKVIRVAAFCKGDKIKDAEAAGADFVGAEDLVAKVQDGWTDFDAAVATPDMMGQVGKIGKILGPRGLMPNPKVGTVTPDIAQAVKAIKAGRVEFRVDKAGIIHVGVGRISFGDQKLHENIVAVVDILLKAKPKNSKGVYLTTAHLATTMGPGIALDPSPLRAL